LFDNECDEEARAVLLGATNSWFPITLSALAIPQTKDPLGQLVRTGGSSSRNWNPKPKCGDGEDPEENRSAARHRQVYPAAIWPPSRPTAGGGQESWVKPTSRDRSGMC
jgi:hypothetical protein